MYQYNYYLVYLLQLGWGFQFVLWKTSYRHHLNLHRRDVPITLFAPSCVMSKSSVSPTCSIWMSLAIGVTVMNSSTKASMLFLGVLSCHYHCCPSLFLLFLQLQANISLSHYSTISPRTIYPMRPWVEWGLCLDVPQEVCCVLKLPKSFLFTFIYQLGLHLLGSPPLQRNLGVR